MAATLRKNTGTLDIKLSIDLNGKTEPVPVILTVERGQISIKRKGCHFGASMSWNNFCKHLHVDVAAPAKYLGDPSLLLTEK